MQNKPYSTAASKAWLRRLNVRVMILFALLLVLAMVVFTWLAIHEESSYHEQARQLQTRDIARLLSEAVTNDLKAMDVKGLEKQLLQTLVFSDMTSVQVLDTAGQVLVNVSRAGLIDEIKNWSVPKLPQIDARKESGRIVVWQPVESDQLIGWVRATSDLNLTNRLESRYWANNTLIGFIVLMIASGILMFILRKPVATFERYTDFAERLDKKEGRQVEVSTSSVEMQKMGNALNRTSTTLYDQDQSIKYAMRRLKGLAAFPRWNPNIVLSMNSQADVQYINPHGTMILKKHGLGMEDIKQLTPKNIVKLVSWCQKENKTVRDVEVKFEGRVFLWTISPVEGEDLLHCYGLEITDRIKAQEEARAAQLEKHSAEAASQAKSAFLAHMSHEIRTPLTAIIGFSEALLDNISGEKERRSAVNIILRSSRHLLHIINEILDLSKIEAQELNVEHEPLALFELVSDVGSLLAIQAQEKGLEFNIKYHYPLPASILSDAVRLKQILINIGSNAIKFTDKGHVQIDVSCQRENETVNFAISDTGIGMSAEQTRKLFRAFSQADSSISREYGGTGLGLHLSQQLAEKLDGKITVQSEEGQGSCFNICLASGPLAEVDWLTENPIKQISDSVDIVALSGKISGHILLAEDNLSNQKLISLYVSSLGATLNIVSNGQLAIQEALSGDYDLVLMDMQMPLMDGLQATSQLRQQGYKQPIIALTANTMQEDINQCIEAGSDDFISKPIDRERFIEVLCCYLGVASKSADVEPLVSEILERDPSFKTLVDAFVKELPLIIKDLIYFYESKDWHELGFKLHDLKSTGGGYGFGLLSQLAKNMEQAIANQDMTKLENGLREIELIYSRIQAGIDMAE